MLTASMHYAKVLSLRTVGYSFILLSLLWFGFSIWPVAVAEAGYHWRNLFNGETRHFGGLSPVKAEKTIVPVDADFGLVVEKIGANSRVIGNVDPANDREYVAALQRGVAHAKGTVLPGQAGNSFLFAHSVLNPWDIPRYNAVFYLLRELEVGDQVVAFYRGKRYNYTVFDKSIVEANDITALTAVYDYPVLTLQTCTPPGTTWKRLIVKARL